MQKHLPSRPNLDYLRRQAKALLASLETQDAKAAETILNHLPAAKNMTADEVLKTKFRLADAQSAVARQSGFASWPHLARHVEQLRSLEGNWEFARLEVDGTSMPAAALRLSRLLIDGDRFRTESPEAIYDGIFNINVETEPHQIDIEFVEGPEAGNWNYGIFRLDGEQLDICLDLNGKPRPDNFATAPGSGRAYETLNRTSKSRPENVTGGKAPAAGPIETQSSSGFEYVESATLTRLQGEWTAVKIISDGRELPSTMLGTGLRTATKNEVKVSFAGQTMLHALVKLDESKDPIHVDYYNLNGPLKGTLQHGLLQWHGREACFCMAAPGQARPNALSAPAGSGRTLTHWRPKE